MGITAFIEKVCVQTAVYWGTPTPNGFGKMVFADPVEIACRWQDTKKVITDSKGVQISCLAELLVTQDLDEQGWVFLGTLDDLDSTQEADPSVVEGAHEIKQIDKIPMIFSTTEFVRKAYL